LQKKRFDILSFCVIDPSDSINHHRSPDVRIIMSLPL
jgi:hypothetical protein